MNYNLNQLSAQQQKGSTFAALRKLLQLIREEHRNLILALGAILTSSCLNLLSPYIMGRVIDTYIKNKQFDGVLRYSALLLGMYLLSFVTSYLQTKMMGGVGQRMLFKLRNTIFSKIQELPVAFFNQNRAGDLISRINNDTDKINQFFSQSLMQFIGSIATMLGAGIFLLSINIRLGAATLVPAIIIFLFIRLVSPWVKRKNAENLKTVGSMSAEVQEGLNNFKVIVAFNRRDYFRSRFDDANRKTYKSAVGAGIANNIFLPVFGFFSSAAQLIVLVYGIYLIESGLFTVGFLISYLAYATNFYNPLRQLAVLWTNFQVAMAGWDRISQILSLQTNLAVIDVPPSHSTTALLEFEKVHFAYPDGKEVLHNVSLKLERGKIYALVGPTGGGKTTTASLIARLYDPTAGTILLDGKDIRSYDASERTRKIGFILQEPFLFTGTIRDNIIYGNNEYYHFTNEQLEQVITDANLASLLSIFEEGLDTKVSATGDSISLGQKQLIAFMRAVLRRPDILILDEATANIDTVTEQLLDEILKKLPHDTTLVIIAHRLNTIESADEIYFVNSGTVIQAGSLNDAVEMLMHRQRVS